MDIQEQQYIKGFNNGYILAQHEPELAAMITKNQNDHSDYFKGLVSGKKEYENEKLKSRLKVGASKKSPTKEITKGKER